MKKTAIHVVLSSPEDIRALVHASKPHMFPTKTTVSLRLTNINAERSAVWERRLSKYAYACGCGTGTVFLIAAVVLYTLATIASLRGHAVTWEAVGVRIALGLVCLFLAAGLGKVVGLVVAQLRFRALCRQLIREVTINMGRERNAKVSRVG